MNLTFNPQMAALLDQFAIRSTLERYGACLDARDFDGLASCFTDTCEAIYSANEKFVGGRAIATWCHGILTYRASIHAVSHARIKLDGDVAQSDSFLVSTLIAGQPDGGPVYIRGVRYQDRLVRTKAGWLIDARTHEVLWQYEALSQVPGLPELPPPAQK